MTVQLLYSDGCPSYGQALENLLKALVLERVATEVELIRVYPGRKGAERFRGSPTILLDGVDIEGPPRDGLTCYHGCRVYLEGPYPMGWPSVDRIREAIRTTRVTPAASSRVN